jgi:hypothetical protein
MSPPRPTPFLELEAELEQARRNSDFMLHPKEEELPMFRSHGSLGKTPSRPRLLPGPNEA